MKARYEIKMFDQFGIPIGKLEDYEQFQLVRSKNDLGTFNVVLPGTRYSINDFLCDYRAEVYRDGLLVGDTCWFLQRREYTLEQGETNLLLTFADSMDILTRRVNAWFSCDQVQCFGAMQGVPGNLMKFLIHANYGEHVTASGLLTDPPNNLPPDFSGGITADVVPAVGLAYQAIYGLTGLTDGRKISDLRIDPFQPLGGNDVIVTQELGFAEILRACQDISNGAYAIPRTDLKHNVWFDIVYTPATPNLPATFTFRTWESHRGIDNREQVYIGPNYGNLSNASFINDCSIKGDIAYILSDGDNTDQVIGSAYLDQNANSYYYELPYGPVEIVTDFSQDSASEDLLIGEGLVALGSANKLKTLEGTIINTKDFNFGEHYNYGDLITLQWQDINETLEIKEFTITVDPQGVETIEIPLEIL